MDVETRGWKISSSKQVLCYIGATDFTSTIPCHCHLHIFKFSFPKQPLIRPNNIHSNWFWWLCYLAYTPLSKNYIRHFNVLSITERNVNDSPNLHHSFPSFYPHNGFSNRKLHNILLIVCLKHFIQYLRFKQSVY